MNLAFSLRFLRSLKSNKSPSSVDEDLCICMELKEFLFGRRRSDPEFETLEAFLS